MTTEVKEVPLGMREMYPYPSMYIADCLNEQKVEIAFGVHGGHVWQMTDAMSNIGIKLVTFRHEQAAVYAAEAYSKVTGKVGVCYVTVGPGTANVVSAIQQAYLSCSPVLLLLGGVEYEHDYTYAIQPAYAMDLFRHITKWTYRCVNPDQFKQWLTRAFKDAQGYPKGPIALEFSLSSFWQPIPPTVPPGIFGQHALYAPQWRGAETDQPMTLGGDPELIQRAVNRIYQAEKPVMLVGDGVHWSNAAPELLEFVELAQIPASNRRIARGALPEVHPLYWSSRIGHQVYRERDLTIALGMKVGHFDGYGGEWRNTIQINESQDHIAPWVKTELAIVGTPKVVLRQMIAYIKENDLKPPAARAEWVRRVQELEMASTQRLRDKAEKYREHRPVHYGWVSKAIWDAVEELYEGKCRVMIDGFTFSDYAPPFIRARYSGQVMDASEQAGVGHGIGMSIGAAFADPETKKRPIIALMGDSGMGNSGMDIEVALRFQLPVIYIVANNNGWLTSMKYTHYGKDWRVLGPQDQPQGSENLPQIRYDKMFEAMGCHGEHVEEPSQFRPALERAFKAAEAGKTAVMNVIVDASIANHQTYSLAFQLCWMHIPWDKLPKRGKALRRNMLRWYPWDKAGVPPMPMPDPWEPITEEELEP